MPPLNWIKIQRRITTIVTSSLNNLLVPILNPVIALVVVRQASVDLWGEFVNLLIIAQLSAHVMAWGNREYLLREFSLQPVQIAVAWRNSFLTRGVMVLVLPLLMVVFGSSLFLSALVVLWVLGLFVAQSCDVLVVYRKDFSFALGVEILSMTILLAGILVSGSELTVEWLIFTFAVAGWIKASALLLRFRRYTLGPNRGFGLSGEPSMQPASLVDWRYFQMAFPFFLLGFSGMLQSRVDLYTVNYFLDDGEVGQYQVFMNLMIYLQSLAYFILNPFLKSLYRLKYLIIRKISRRLFVAGILLVIPGLVIASRLLVELYRFPLKPVYFFLGALFVLPIYYYLPVIYVLFKADYQTTVLKINLFGTALTFGLSLILLPRLGMLGALVATTSVRWVVFLFYQFQGRSLSRYDPAAMPQLSSTP